MDGGDEKSEERDGKARRGDCNGGNINREDERRGMLKSRYDTT